MRRSKHSWRQIKAIWRDTFLLIRQFHRPLIFFLVVMVGFGSLYSYLSGFSTQPTQNWAEGVYSVLTMAFLNPVGSFPTEFYLQVFYFIMPVIGISVLAQGLADFGILFFNRRSRAKEWEMAIASTFNRHIVLVGLGHLGFRIVKILQDIGEDVVVVSLDPQPNLVESIRSMGVPMIGGDGARESILEGAGIKKARSIILCTQNDSLNLQIALKARAMQPQIDVIIRIFDDEFASALQKQFGFRALSATGMAAPAFASSATRVDITPPITIDGNPHSLARFKIGSRAPFIGKTLGAIEDQYDVSIVLLNHDGRSDTHPSGGLYASSGDTLAVLGAPEAIQKIAHDNSE